MFFAKRCDICDTLIKRKSYTWKLAGTTYLTCPTCSRQLDQKKSSAAFGTGRAMEVPPKIQRPFQDLVNFVCYVLMAILVVGGVIAFFVYKETSNESAAIAEADQEVARKEAELEKIEESRSAFDAPRPLTDAASAHLIMDHEWTDLEGRVLRATLIDAIRRDDGSYFGKFRKPDGTEFKYDILKLSRPDRLKIKQALVRAGRIEE